jgi:hypothetical protein
MVAPTPLKGGGADVTASLDLSQIQSLATSVTDQTGLGALPIKVAVTASAVVAVGSAKPVTYTSQLPLQLTTLELTMAGAKVTNSARGPAVVSTRPLSPNAATASQAHHSGPSSRDMRLGLLALVLLAIAATAVVWPAASNTAIRADSDAALERTETEPSSRPRSPSHHSSKDSQTRSMWT